MFKYYSTRLAATALLGVFTLTSWAQTASRVALTPQAAPPVANAGGGGGTDPFPNPNPCLPPTPIVPDGGFEGQKAGTSDYWGASIATYNTYYGTSNAYAVVRCMFPNNPYPGTRVINVGEGNSRQLFATLNTTLSSGKRYYTQCSAIWDSNYNFSTVYYDRAAIIITPGTFPLSGGGFQAPATVGHNIFGVVGGGPNGPYPGSPISGQFTANGNETDVTVGLFAGGTASYVSGIPFGGNFVFDNVGIWEIPTAGPQKDNVCAPVQIGTRCTDMPAGTTYAWSSPDDPSVSSATLPYVTVDPPGKNVTYTLTVTLPDGTTYTTTVQVNRADRCAPVERAMTSTSASLSEVFPIPADKEVHVRAATASEATLYNAYSFPVQRLKLQAGESTLNTGPLPEGVYYLRFVENGKAVSKRVVVRH